MLDATVAYAQVREQFGRPIGSFQAVKHRCADMLVQPANGFQLVPPQGHAPAPPRAARDHGAAADAGVDAAMAAAYLGDAVVAIAGTALQLHGGIGSTWESGVPVDLKRATLDRSLFGSPAAHRRRLAGRCGTVPAA